MKRRSFVKQSSLFAISSVSVPIDLDSFSFVKTIRFGLATDSHYADRDFAGTRYYRDSLDKMREFVEEMNKEKVDFLIHLGDFKDQGVAQEESDTLRFLEDIETVYAKFKGPRFHCVGNHDVDSITKEQFLSKITNTGIASDKSYYSFDQNNFHFIVLDGNHHKDGTNHFYKDGADWQDPNLGQKQIAWLKKDLSKTENPTIVFCHQLLFEPKVHGSRHHVSEFKQVQEILKETDRVVAVFQGHIHKEIVEQINATQYITQLGMVDFEGIENNSFCMVEVDKRNLKIEGYKRTTTKSFKV